MNNSAAVLIGVLDQQIVLTKRSQNLRHFTGHICLPGGKYDHDDALDFANTAVREFNEEVYFQGSITPQLCMLAETSVINQQAVIPVLAYLEGEISGFSPDEVEQLILLPLNELKADKFVLNRDYPTIKHNQCLFYHGHKIWGLTAHILKQFSQNYLKYLY